MPFSDTGKCIYSLDKPLLQNQSYSSAASPQQRTLQPTSLPLHPLWLPPHPLTKTGIWPPVSRPPILTWVGPLPALKSSLPCLCPKLLCKIASVCLAYPVQALTPILAHSPCECLPPSDQALTTHSSHPRQGEPKFHLVHPPLSVIISHHSGPDPSCWVTPTCEHMYTHTHSAQALTLQGPHLGAPLDVLGTPLPSSGWPPLLWHPKPGCPSAQTQTLWAGPPQAWVPAQSWAFSWQAAPTHGCPLHPTWDSPPHLLSLGLHCSKREGEEGKRGHDDFLTVFFLFVLATRKKYLAELIGTLILSLVLLWLHFFFVLTHTVIYVTLPYLISCTLVSHL